MLDLIDNLNAIGLNVIVMDDDEDDMVECPSCGGEMWNDGAALCEECEHERGLEEEEDND